MNTRIAGTLAAALALTAAAGCTSTATPDAAQTPPSPSASASATTSPTAATATVEQYASIVASVERDLRQAAKSTECEPTVPACALTMLSIQPTAGLLARELQAAPDEIGYPPAEIAALVSDTAAKAREFEKAGEKMQRVCSDRPASVGCLSQQIEAGISWGSLESTLDAWGPYL